MTADDFITMRPSAETLAERAHGKLKAPTFVIDSNRERAFRVEFARDPMYFSPSIGKKNSRDYFSATIDTRQPGKEISRREGWSAIGSGDNAFKRIFYTFKEWQGLIPGQMYYRVSTDPERASDTVVNSSSIQPKSPFLYTNRQSDPIFKPSIPFDPLLPELTIDWQNMQLVQKGKLFRLRGVNVSGLGYRRYFWGEPGTPDSPNQVESGLVLETDIDESRRRDWVKSAVINEGLFKVLKGLGVNVIRLPLNQDWVIRGYHDDDLPVFKAPPERYLEAIDEVIQMAVKARMYVILDLQLLRLIPRKDKKCQPDSDAEISRQRAAQQKLSGLKRSSIKSSANAEARNELYQGHLPDMHSWLFWSIIATRYKGVSNVLYDLFNEPHKTLEGCLEASHEYTGLAPPARVANDLARLNNWWADHWKTWATGLWEVINTIDEKALVLIAGIHGPVWSSSLRDMPIILNGKPLPNAIYKAHLYWGEAESAPAGAAPLPDLKQPSDWRFWLKLKNDRDANQAGLNEKALFFIGEWGMQSEEALFQVSRKAGQTATAADTTAWTEYWKDRGVKNTPRPEEIKKWGDNLVEFLKELCKKNPAAGGDQKGNGFAGWTAWSTLDAPCIFQQEKPSDKYLAGLNLTDHGKLVEAALKEPDY
ncbi:MAG: endoglucanase [Blastocatellia bacterium]|jgi:hypothetical protein|nr:endoglucanase [Blastocatellia bacterium]